nr:proline-rich protein 2-like [Dasypus novemcinctus]
MGPGHGGHPTFFAGTGPCPGQPPRAAAQLVMNDPQGRVTSGVGGAPNTGTRRPGLASPGEALDETSGAPRGQGLRPPKNRESPGPGAPPDAGGALDKEGPQLGGGAQERRPRQRAQAPQAVLKWVPAAPGPLLPEERDPGVCRAGSRQMGAQKTGTSGSRRARQAPAPGTKPLSQGRPPTAHVAPSPLRGAPRRGPQARPPPAPGPFSCPPEGAWTAADPSAFSRPSAVPKGTCPPARAGTPLRWPRAPPAHTGTCHLPSPQGALGDPAAAVAGQAFLVTINQRRLRLRR